MSWPRLGKLRKEFHYLKDAVHCSSRIVEKTLGIDLEQLKTDPDLQDIVEYNLRIVAEAIKQLPEDWRSKQPQIAWKKIAGMRNMLVHRYYEIDMDIVIEICRNHIGPLNEALKAIAREVSGPLLAQDDLPE